MSPCTEPRFESMLHAYELHLLEDDDRRLLELHLLECEHCYTRVHKLEDAMDMINKDEDLRHAVNESIPSGKPDPSDAHPGSSRIQVRRWTRFAIAAAIVLVAGIAVVRFSITEPTAPQVNQTILLMSTRADDVQTLSLAHGGLAGIQFVYEEVESDQAYDVTIQSRQGEVVFSKQDFAAFNAQGVGEVVISVDNLKPGPYYLLLRISGDSDSESLRQYGFGVK